VNSSYTQKNQTAILTLTDSGSGQKRNFPCQFGGLQSKRLTLECQERPAISAAISVEYGDAMFLGEVVSAHSLPHGYWQIDVHVEQVLSGLQSLLALRCQLLGEAVVPRMTFQEMGVYA